MGCSHSAILLTWLRSSIIKLFQKKCWLNGTKPPTCSSHKLMAYFYLWWWSYLWDEGSYFPPTSTTMSHVFKTASSLERKISASLYSGNIFNMQHANTSSQWNVPLWVPIIFLELCFFVKGSVAMNAIGSCRGIVPFLLHKMIMHLLIYDKIAGTRYPHSWIAQIIVY